ncbi:hypothetical protein SPBR_07963 [Sporothrix brasiliensis 5110]|uniref:Uncharacterized protein n=1 Tax=Sporothrix brasiliensis 5110 TaxID=1398154 RepID=A0A0C2EQI3_9PEZI|nr:uncharacterized protein SPBR_07963 [Sporothrix brasiliensis 5110]KIH88604.1 hypothetical protein SPBR_07963 [Sporothrix brasiliensis 5110]
MVTEWALVTSPFWATRISAGLSVKPRSRSSGVCDHVVEDEELVPAESLRERALDKFIKGACAELLSAFRWDCGSEIDDRTAFGRDLLELGVTIDVPHDWDWAVVVLKRLLVVRQSFEEFCWRGSDGRWAVMMKTES